MSQNFVIPFGKYKDHDLLHVAELEPKYLVWLDSVATGELKDALESFLDSKYAKYVTLFNLGYFFKGESNGNN